MMIKDYIRLLVKRWWLLALAFIVVFASTYVWTSRQTPVYESHATFVIRPRSGTVVSDDFIKALDTISNRSEINSTFAEVSSSKSIREQAIKKMNLSSDQRKGLSATGSVIAGTNILEITAQSHDPVIARDFADAVGAETVDYVKNLYDVYQLEGLDSANTPSKPIKPDLVLNLTLGAFLGLALGVALIFLLEALKPSYKELDTFNIIDRETGAYNKSYLTHRLFQEMVRTRRTKSPLSLGLVKVNFNGGGLSEPEQAEALRMVKILTEKSIREEDILVRFNGVTFAILFPDLPLESARDSLENVRQVIGSVAHDMNGANGHSHIDSYSSVVSYTGGRVSQERFVEQALQGLQNISPQ
ncbi:MAG: diguanylate cyclase [Chloroflexi bacterium]|nr:diguanylate cyclase [Chloroflexota bacterium]